MSRELKDWPQPLKLNAVVCDLAKTIYYAQAEVYGGHLHWYGLSDALKAEYVSKAANVLQGCAPVTRYESRSPDGDGSVLQAPRLDGRDVQTHNAGAPVVRVLATREPLPKQEAESAASGGARAERGRGIAGSEPADSHSLFHKVTAVARAEAARVLGRIDPQTPREGGQ